jgi:carboxypeptidase Q
MSYRFTFAAGAALICGMVVAPPDGRAQGERIDTATVARIRDEGLNHSQVMDHIVWLSDVYGPRLEGSPEKEEAAGWAMKTMKSWGLADVREQRFPFGKGWSLEHFSAEMIEPRVSPLIAYPKAWTPGTNGPVEAEVVRAEIASEADFAKYRGKLRGRIVLTQPVRMVRMLDGRIVLRMGEKEIDEALHEPSPTPSARGGSRGRGAMREFQQKLDDFYKSEGVVALLDRGTDADSAAGGSDLSWYAQKVDGGTIFVGSGGTRDSTAGSGLPQITVAVEHYNRMVRILDKGVPVKMRLDVRTRFHDESSPRGFNILAEIPGTDPKLKDEVVLIGSHFDSWHSGTGATDNATGSAAMMEAMRILKSVGAKPRRTIRIGLWGGEEEGLLGSRHYASEYIGDANTMQAKPGLERFDAYYNIDNGTGKIRGIWMEGNAGVAPIFQAFTAPLRDLGVEILSPRSVTSTDHMSFTAFGLPAFQFVQERYEYNSRTHHSNMDVVDRVQPDDMKQMATVVATMAYLTAQRDEKLPRKVATAGK